MKNNSSFRAGVAKVDITPSLGTIIGADFLPHYARFIHDPLFAKAIVFNNRSQFVLIVIVDICIMETEFMDQIKIEVHKQFGISEDSFLLASNHNHAAGDVISLLGGAADIAYKKKLPGLIIEAVKKAKNNLQAAKIASGAVDVPDFVLCRRYIMHESYQAKNPVTRQNDLVKTNPFGAEHLIIGPAAPTDPELSFLAVKTLDDKWLCILANYSLHYVGDWPDDSITGDYFGEFSKIIKEKLNGDDDFVGIMSNGTSGDVNIWDFMNPDRFPKENYEKTKLIGGQLAEKIYNKTKELNWEDDPELLVEFNKIEIEVRKPSKEEFEIAKNDFILNDFNNLSLKDDMIQRIYDREQLLLSEYPPTTQVSVQAIKIGKLIIGALPGEFFAETGLKLKAALKPNSYFTISLANAYGGYVPPAHEIAKGGYETWRARSSFLTENAEEIIRNSLLKLIKKLF
jgi:neutral ceramidase